MPTLKRKPTKKSTKKSDRHLPDDTILFLRVPHDLRALLVEQVENLNKTRDQGLPPHSQTSLVLGILYTVLAGGLDKLPLPKLPKRPRKSDGDEADA